MQMDFTKSFIRSKNPCADGFRWYLRHHRNGSEYQQVLDDLVKDGRVEDAWWLLDKVGPSNTVLKLDSLECDAIVYAGSIEVKGSIEVGSVLRTGGAVRCGGAIRAGTNVCADDDIRVQGGLNCGGNLSCTGSVVADWHLTVGGRLQADDLKVGGNVSCADRMVVAGSALVKGDLSVGGDCIAKALSVRGCIETSGSLRVWQGLICDGHIGCGIHLDAGWGIKAAGDILAGGAVRAGEGLEAGGSIRAGKGYGVFAGLCVQREDWETSARVSAQHKPNGLMSGFWADSQKAVHCISHGKSLSEPKHAD